ncbi:MAG: T9SS type A sorting domain-containing protein [Bacteroidota bacterium]
METGGSYTIETCSEPTELNLGMYSHGIEYSIDISRDQSVFGELMVIVDPNYFDQTWDIDANSSLLIYETSQAGELLGVFNSATHPDGFQLSTSASTLTFVFEGNGSGDGFELLIFCQSEFNKLPSYEAIVETAGGPWFLNEETGDIEALVCEDQTVTYELDLATLFTGDELPDEMNFKWWMGDSTVYEGINLNEVTHSYEDGPGKILKVWFWDSNGFGTFRSVVKLSERPNFQIEGAGTELCLNEQVELIGGVDGNEVVGATPGTEGTVEITEFYGIPRFLPDGNGDVYSTSVDVIGLDEGTVIGAGTTLNSICVNFEHTYLGDLEMWLTCPNGQSALLFDGFFQAGLYEDGLEGFGAGGTFMGDANDDDTENPGIGFNYCFSDNGDLGTMADEFVSGNTVPVSSFDDGGEAMIGGTYLPASTFETAFSGCPVNGEWSLFTVDNIGADNGFIFEWYVSFETDEPPGIYEYEIDLADAEWEENPGFSGLTETSVVYEAYAEDAILPVFTVTDDSNCEYSETADLTIIEIAPSFTEDEGVCTGYILPWSSTYGEVLVSSGNADAIEIEPDGEFFAISNTEAGTFEFNYQDLECGNDASATITFLSPDDPSCLTSASEILFKPELTLAPNPTEGSTRLSFELFESQNLRINVFDSAGKTVLQVPYFGTVGENAIDLALDEMESGLYLVSVEGKTVKTITKLAIQ